MKRNDVMVAGALLVLVAGGATASATAVLNWP